MSKPWYVNMLMITTMPQIIAKLWEHYTDSKLSRCEIMCLYMSIVTIRIDSSWKGTTTKFLYYFKEQLHLLDNICPTIEQLCEAACIVFLMHFVRQPGW